ncbi:glutathione S-transferase family protein [Salinisphaera sp.]|uniref:glutathione S-transferase family protein n=1 Tax=Salinisphaera sp. TaxID=1914330 RepID=UPI002D77E842|nr:glutathione S-transferase family protein [Salinisphaera sp.]HET7315557.1 glutathione S-transferase family protein [Salinisphaera sp.]
MTLALYGHRLSQPCRAAEILLRELPLPYAWHEVDFANGETREPEYARRINGFQTVPALRVTADEAAPARSADGLHIGESHAIMRYLCRTADSHEAAAWYPGDRDAARAARIDQWLDWHHANIRRYDLFHDLMNLHFTLPMLKREIQADALKPRQDGLRPGLNTIESRLNGTFEAPTLCGDGPPTIADLAIACELYQIVAVGYRLAAFPGIQRWLDALSRRPHFAAVSEQIVEQGRAIRDRNAPYLNLDDAFV